MTEFYSRVEYYFHQVTGDKYFLILWLLAVLCLFLLRKKERSFFTYPFLVLILFIVNPLTGKILMNFLDDGSYARFVWCLLVDIIIAFAMTELVTIKNNIVYRGCITIVCLCMIAFSGKWLLSSENFEVPENEYKISNVAIEICDIIEERHGGQPIIIYGDILNEVRQYDADVVLAYGRYVRDEDRIENIINGDRTQFYEYFTSGIGRMAECLVLPDIQGLPDELWVYGWIADTRLEGYVVYEKFPGNPIWN